MLADKTACISDSTNSNFYGNISPLQHHIWHNIYSLLSAAVLSSSSDGDRTPSSGSSSDDDSIPFTATTQGAGGGADGISLLASNGSLYVDGLHKRSSSMPCRWSSSLSDDVGDDDNSCKSHDSGDGDVISLLSPLAAASLCFCRRSCTCRQKSTNVD